MLRFSFLLLLYFMAHAAFGQQAAPPALASGADAAQERRFHWYWGFGPVLHLGKVIPEQNEYGPSISRVQFKGLPLGGMALLGFEKRNKQFAWAIQADYILNCWEYITYGYTTTYALGNDTLVTGSIENAQHSYQYNIHQLSLSVAGSYRPTVSRWRFRLMAGLANQFAFSRQGTLRYREDHANYNLRHYFFIPHLDLSSAYALSTKPKTAILRLGVRAHWYGSWVQYAVHYDQPTARQQMAYLLIEW